MRRIADNFPSGRFIGVQPRAATALAVVAASALALTAAVLAATTTASANASVSVSTSQGDRAAGVEAAALRLSPARAARLSADVTTPVIVFLKDQPAVVSPDSARSAARNGAIAASQAPFLRELAEVHATDVKSYRLVNAFAATVSADEGRLLAADPAVAQVIPDGTIEGPSPAVTPSAGRRSASAPTRSSVLPGACLPDGKAELEPEGLSLTRTDSQTPGAPTARALGFTGAGVTVGFMADGIDPDNVNFLRPDGKSVFTRYVDFSSDGIDAPTDGDEAFLDANAIARRTRSRSTPST